jgi:hypothetical protein
MSSPKPKLAAAPNPPPLFPHPLFEPDDPDAEVPIVYKILVARFERGGKYVTHPHRWQAEELTDLEQIYELFGGGDYELIAYGPRGATCRRRVTLPGKARPFMPGEDDDDVPPREPLAAVNSAPSGDGDRGLLIAVMNAGQQTQATMFSAMMSLVTAMMTSGRDAANAQVAQMAQVFASANQSQAQILASVMQAKGGGAGSKDLLDALREGIGIGKESGAAGGEDDELESLAEMAAPFIQGAMAAQQSTGSGSPAQDEGE